MKTFFNELFEYNHHSNQKVTEQVMQHSEMVSAKAISLFSHVLNTHQIWNTRISEDQKPFEVWQVHRPHDYLEIDFSNFKRSLDIIKNFELTRIISYQNSKGTAFENNVKDVLFHVINHSNYHRAQIATELKVEGLEPLNTDWITYKR